MNAVSLAGKPPDRYCGGIGGTGNRKYAGTWRNTGLAGNYFIKPIEEGVQWIR